MKIKKLRALAFLMSFLFVVLSFLLTAYAKDIGNELQISKGWFGCEGKWIYQKNNDNENTITLVKCNTTGSTKLTSKIDSYDVTRIGDNFSAIHVDSYVLAVATFMGMCFLCLTIIGIPFVVIVVITHKPDSNQSLLEKWGCSYDTYSNITKVDLPKCISVGVNAFKLNVNLSTVSLPKCTKIGDGAFLRCESLEKVDIPECQEIGHSAFDYCRKLKSLNLPNCRRIGTRAFADCRNLESITADKCEKISSCAFDSCVKLKTVYFPNCKMVDARAFSGCYSLRKIVVSKGCYFYSNSMPIGNLFFRIEEI